jgi:hypothetical protein
MFIKESFSWNVGRILSIVVVVRFASFACFRGGAGWNVLIIIIIVVILILTARLKTFQKTFFNRNRTLARLRSERASCHKSIEFNVITGNGTSSSSLSINACESSKLSPTEE